MIDPAAVEQAWQGPWQKMPRSLRRFHVAMSAGLGVMAWLFLPLTLLGAAFNEAERGVALGTAAWLFFGGLVPIAVAIFLHRRWGPEHDAQDALKVRGLKVTGHMLRSRYVPSYPNNPLCSFYLFGAEVPGGPPVFAHLTARNGVPIGCPATIAYDPARPGEGVVVETVGQLKRRARRG